MKKCALVFLLFLMQTLTAQRKEAELGVGAIGLVVSDIKASEHFYEDILEFIPAGGFELDKQWAIDSGASNNRPFGVKMYKQVNGDSATVLKLAYFNPEVSKRTEQNGIAAYAGANYLTFYYNGDDFYRIAEKLKKEGYSPLGWVKRERYQLFFVKDPNGVFIELIGPPEE